MTFNIEYPFLVYYRKRILVTCRKCVQMLHYYSKSRFILNRDVVHCCCSTRMFSLYHESHLSFCVTDCRIRCLSPWHLSILLRMEWFFSFVSASAGLCTSLMKLITCNSFDLYELENFWRSIMRRFSVVVVAFFITSNKERLKCTTVQEISNRKSVDHVSLARNERKSGNDGVKRIGAKFEM